MAERRIDLPEGVWERLRKRPGLLIAAVITGIIVLGVAAAVFLTRSRPTAVNVTPPPKSGVQPSPSPETPGSRPGTRTSEPTSSSKPSTTPPAKKPQVVTPAPTLARAPLVAYHIGEKLFVARDDGGSPVQVGTADVAAMSLSPDGKTLAVVAKVGEGNDRLVLVDVVTKAQVEVGPAEALAPEWESSSASLVYQLGGHSPQVRRVHRDGTGDVGIIQGANPGISPNGAAVIASEPSVGTKGGTIRVFRSGAASSVPTQGFASALAGGTSAIWFATPDGGYAGGEVWTVGYDGGGMRRLAALPNVGPASPEAILPSPTQRRLLVGVLGDDGFSRAFVVDLAGRVTPITARRDVYPVGWSADGQRVLYIEGNLLLGEPTRLMTARPDDTGKRVLIEGAQP